MLEQSLTVSLAPLVLRLTMLTALAAMRGGAAQTPPARAEGWRQDVRLLAAELPKRHKNLFFKVTREEFGREAGRLIEGIPTMSDAEIKAAIFRLVAMAGDAHTQVWWNRADFTLFPFTLYRFGDGWRVIQAGEDYRSAVGARLVQVGETDIERAASAMRVLIACENESCFAHQLPNYLIVAEFLQALKFIAEPARARFVFEDDSGRRFALDVRAAPGREAVKWVNAFDAQKTSVPLYRRRPELNYWFEYLADTQTLYVNYSKCREMPAQSFSAFAAEVFAFADRHEVARFVVDLRRNGGGNEALFLPLVEGLRSRPALNRRDRLFVLIGRGMYSSAVNNATTLRSRTTATFVGEPTGQKPNHYGEVLKLRLPNSGLEVGYSSKYFKRVAGDPAAVVPDVAVSLSFADYLAGRDPALEAAIRADFR